MTTYCIRLLARRDDMVIAYWHRTRRDWLVLFLPSESFHVGYFISSTTTETLSVSYFLSVGRPYDPFITKIE